MNILVRIYNRCEDFLFDHTPRIMLTDTLQTATAIAWIGVGLGSLLTVFLGGPAGAVGAALPLEIMRILWGVSMLIGGVFQVIGLQRISRDAERAGMAFSFLGAFVYACALFAASSTLAGLVLGFVFIMYAVAFWILLRASARAKRSLAK